MSFFYSQEAPEYQQYKNAEVYVPDLGGDFPTPRHGFPIFPAPAGWY